MMRLISGKKKIKSITIFFSYRKDWSRVGVATLQEIGQDRAKRLEKGLADDCMFFFLSPHRC
jgi:hypothetical protein